MWPPRKLIPDLHSLNFTKEKMNWLSITRDQTMKILLQSDQIVSGNHSLSHPQFLSSLFVFENEKNILQICFLYFVIYATNAWPCQLAFDSSFEEFLSKTSKMMIIQTIWLTKQRSPSSGFGMD